MGTFSPPDDNNDGIYDPDTDCLWRLIARENKVVVLDIQEIDVACEFEYVEVSIYFCMCNISFRNI